MTHSRAISTIHQKPIHLAVLAAIPALILGNLAYADGTCTSRNGIVNCTGAFAGGATGGTIMVVPSNYTTRSADETIEAAETTIVGYSNKADYGISNIGSMNVNVSKFTTLNIGSGTTSPTYGVAPDSTTTVVTGLKAVPGFYDPYNGGTPFVVGDTPSDQATKLSGAQPLVNFEGVEIQQAGTVNNFGVITNVSSGNNLSPLSTATYLISNGPKVYTEGGADNLPYRTIGVWVNGSDTKLNNYGVITTGINDSGIANSQPGVTGTYASLYTTPLGSGTAFAATFCSGTETSGVCLGQPAGTIKTITGATARDKAVVYGVLATSDTDDFQQNVRVNNYNKIGAYNYTTNVNNATVVALEVKENIIDTHVLNAKGAVIEGVSSLLTASGVRSAGTVTAGVGNNTYTTPTGSVNAIGTDNNAYQLYVDNFGTITSYGVNGAGVANGVYGVAIASSTGEMYLNNHAGANIFGDITVGRSENKFVFTNAGTLTGNIKITPDNSSLTPELQNGSYVDVSTAGSTANKIIIQPVINKAGGGNTVDAVGQITGGIYVGTGTGTHPFELNVQPLVASGVTVKSGDTYQFSTNNISIQSGAKETPYTNGVAGTASQITSANIHVLSSALVNWSFIDGTTNQVVASVKDASTISGISLNSQQALNALMTSNNSAASVVQNLTSEEDVRKAANQLRPQVNGANLQASMNVTDKVLGLVDTRLSETHIAQLSGKSGISTGEQPSGIGVWMQAFGFRGEQDTRKEVDGYTADAYGFMAGFDKAIQDDLRVGAAASYGQSNLKDKGDNQGNSVKVDSYQATLYASKLLDGWYLNTTLGLGKHNYDSNRLVLGSSTKGNHDGMQYTARVDAGMPFKIGQTILTPLTSLTYSHLNQDGYTESGVGALSVNSQSTDSIRSGLGGKALLTVYDKSVKANLELRTIWNHEFANTAQDTTATFVGGGAAFTTSGVKPARDSLNLGASVIFSGQDSIYQQNLIVSYDADVKDQYLSHTAKVQARYDF